MSQPSSRYAQCHPHVFTSPDGRSVTYLGRRFSPPGSTLPTLTQVTVTAGERLDSIAARTLGNPLLFWRIADANDAVAPQALLRPIGRVLRVPVPRPGQ